MLLYNPYVADTGRLTKRHREELPHVRGQGQKLRVPGCDGAGTAERSHLTPKARGSGREESTHIQGAVTAWVQEGLEEPSYVEDQEGWQ